MPPEGAQHPEVPMATSMHTFVATHRDELLALWLKKVKGWNPVGHTDDELIEGMPQFFDVLIAALARGDDDPGRAALGAPEIAAAHGRQRFQRGFDVVTIARDYSSISDAIGALGGQHRLAFRSRDYHVFNLCLDAGVAAALDEFWQEARARADYQHSERVGILAHELRNALSSANMAFEILAEGRVDIHSGTGQVLRRSLNRMAHLVEQTLVASSLGAGVQPTLRPLSLATWLVETTASVAAERGITIALDLAPELTLEGDESMLGAAITNLLHNAVKFTRADGRIVLRAGPAGDHITIEVEDQCGGLDPGAHDRLFAPFVQGGRDQRGVGLGLTIARDAVLAHGGRLDLRDLPGHGCVFVITLPRSAEARAGTRLASVS